MAPHPFYPSPEGFPPQCPVCGGDFYADEDAPVVLEGWPVHPGQCVNEFEPAYQAWHARRKADGAYRRWKASRKNASPEQEAADALLWGIAVAEYVAAARAAK